MNICDYCKHAATFLDPCKWHDARERSGTECVDFTLDPDCAGALVTRIIRLAEQVEKLEGSDD